MMYYAGVLCKQLGPIACGNKLSVRPRAFVPLPVVCECLLVLSILHCVAEPISPIERQVRCTTGIAMSIVGEIASQQLAAVCDGGS
jgi:hypothetical protein